MRNQNGMTLVELVVVVSAAALVMVATAAYSVPYMQKQTMRSATYTVQHNLQLARIEAIARNRDVRFVIDTTTNEVSVLDSKGTPGDTTDDELLYEDSFSDSVFFARPDGGDAVTLDPLNGNEFQVEFSADGSVPADSIGEVYLHGGEDFTMVAVYGAGGVEVEMWNGSAWAGGSSSGGSSSSSIPDTSGTETTLVGSGVDVIPIVN